jgi:hypothetical protein
MSALSLLTHTCRLQTRQAKRRQLAAAAHCARVHLFGRILQRWQKGLKEVSLLGLTVCGCCVGACCATMLVIVFIKMHFRVIFQLQMRRICSMNMRARHHRYVFAATAAFRSFLVSVTLRRRQRHQLEQQLRTGAEAHKHHSLKAVFNAWFTLHCCFVRKRINLASSCAHCRRSSLSRIMFCFRTHLHRCKLLRAFVYAVASAFQTMLMQKVVCAWLELRSGWRFKRQR